MSKLQNKKMLKSRSYGKKYLLYLPGSFSRVFMLASLALTLPGRNMNDK
jgi:hypothetical protein